jgi:Ankyrin repeats (3 copies)
VSSYISLTSAVNSGDENAVSVSLDNGADVNERTSGGQTAVILAVIRGYTNIVRLLAKAGADPYERDNLGLNALDWAQRRGATEAIQILTSISRSSTPPRRITINLEEPLPEVTQAEPAAETRESVSEAEKSRRWVTGLKQRLDEQAQRRTSRSEPPPPQQEAVAREPEPEPEPVEPEPPPSIEPPAEPSRFHSSRILTPPPVTETGKRKRCPKCNAIYNSDLLSYCAYDMAPLIDADAPNPSEVLAPKQNPPLFWIMVIITLLGSIVVGSLITAYLYKSNQAAAHTAAEKTVQKGAPELGGNLVGKSVSLPEAECPVRGREPVSGTVTVFVLVAKNGQVYKARGSGGDWLMRGCATEAAMKSTFDPEKLSDREGEGTITYTFKP